MTPNIRPDRFHYHLPLRGLLRLVAPILLAGLLGLAIPMAIRAAAPVVTAAKTVSLKTDVNGNGKANPGDTLGYTVQINGSVDIASGVVFTDTLDANTSLAPGSLRTTPVAVDDGYDVFGNIRIDIPAPGVLANDFGLPTPAVTPASGFSAHNGNYTVNANGSFSFNPAPGYTGADSFTYTVINGNGSDSAAVNLTITNMVWFVNSSLGSNGDGRLSAPFNNLASLNSAATVAGDILYIYQGANYTGTAISLKASQKLYGQSVDLASVLGPAPTGSLAYPPVTGRTNLSNSGSVTIITLANDNTLQGFNISPSGAAGSRGIGNVSAGANTASDVYITASGSAHGLHLDPMNGSFTYSSSGSITASGSAVGVWINAGNGAFSLAAPLSASNLAQPIHIYNMTGGSAAFSGLVSSTGLGVDLSTNASYIHFTGGLTLNSGTNTALAATGAGQLEVSGASNTLQTTTATALFVSGVTISPGLTFQSISATGASANAGIYLNATGASGGLSVTGAGSAGSGGAINNKTGSDGAAGGSCVYLSATRNASLAWMNLHDCSNYAIYGTSVNGLALSHLTINGVNGTNSGAPYSEGSITLVNLSGSAAIDNSAVSGGLLNNLDVENSSGTLNRLTVSNTTVGANSTASGNDGLLFAASGGTANLTVQNSTFTSARANLIDVTGSGAAVVDVSINNNTFSNNHPSILSGGGGLTLASSGSGVMTYHVANNSLRDAVGNALTVNKVSGSGRLSGSILTNAIGVSGVVDSGSSQADGIMVSSSGTGQSETLVQGNTIYQYNGAGISLWANDGSSAVNATIQGNTVAQPGGFAYAGIYLDAGAVPGDSNPVCAAVGGSSLALQNTINGSGSGNADFWLNVASSAVVRVPGYAGGASDDAAITTYVAGLNRVSPAGLAFHTPPGAWGGGAACSAPLAMQASPILIGQPAPVQALPGRGSAAPRPLERPAASPSGKSGITATPDVQVGPFSLPAGKHITIYFDAVIHNLLPGGVTQVCNQGQVSGSNFSPVLTDDPVVGGASDPTCMPVVQEADLSVSKSDGLASLVPGVNATYTIIAANSGPAGAPGAALLDAFPAVFLSPAWTCTASGGAACPSASGVGSLPASLDLPSGGSLTFLVTGQVDPAATGTLANTVSIAVPAGMEDPAGANNTATDTDSLTPQADLSVTKTDGSTTAVPGTNDTYTIVFANSGPSNAPGSALADSYPAVFTGVTWTCTASGGATCPSASGAGSLPATADLPAGGSLSFSVTGTISAAATGALANTATVAAPAAVSETNPGNNSATDTDSLTPQADLSVTKTDGQASVAPGGSVVYTIVFSNLGPSDDPLAAFADTLPGSLSNVGWSCTASGGAACPSASGVGSFDAAGLYLPAGGALTYTLTGDIDPAATGQITNTAAITPSVTDLSSGNNTASDVDDLVPSADLSVTKTHSPAMVTPGLPVTYTVTAANHGPSNVPSATLADVLPPELTGAAWTCAASGGATCPAASGSGSLSETFALPVNGSLFYTISGTVSHSASGNLINTAQISSTVSDPNPGDNRATDFTILVIVSDLSVTKTDGITTAVSGASITYTIVYANAGPSDNPAVTLSDPFPPEFTGPTWTCAASGGAVCPAASGSGSLSFSGVAMPAGSQLTFLATGVIDPSYTGWTENTAGISSPYADPNQSNDAAADFDHLLSLTDLSVTKDDGVTVAAPGLAVTYTIVVHNAGPANSGGAILYDAFPPSLNPVTWTCAPTGASSCPNPSGSGDINEFVFLLAGDSLVYTAAAAIDPAAAGYLTNTVTVQPGEGQTDPNASNDSAADVDRLSNVPDLSVTKTDGSASAVPGQALNYTITAANAGPSNVTGASLVDSLPPALSGASWTCAAFGTATCPAPSGVGTISTTVNLPASTHLVFVLHALLSPAATGALTNSVQIEPPLGISDDIPANNLAFDVDTLTPQADLSVTKTDGKVNQIPGANDAYSIVFANAGPSDAPGAALADIYPAAFTGVTWTCTAAGAAACPAPSGIGSLPASADLPAGGSLSVTVTGTVNPAATGTLANTATVSAPAGVTDATPGNNSATDTDSLTPQADLSVTKTDGVASIVPGANNTYTLVFANAGPSDAPGAALADVYPAAFTGVTWTCVASGGAACPSASGAGALPAADLPAGGSLSFSVTGGVSAAATGALSNTATVAAPPGVTDATPGNNSATDTDTFTPQADLSVTKTDGKAAQAPGANDTYTILFANAGPSDAPDAILADSYPAVFTGVTWTCAASGGAVCPAPSGIGSLPSVADLPAGGSLSFTVTGVVSAAATGTLSNTATVTPPAGVIDATPGNNSATDTDSLAPQADLSVTKTDGSAAAVPGTNDTYTLVFANAGPSDAPGAFLADTYPVVFTGVTWTCAASGGATCPSASGAGSLPAAADLPAGGSLTFTVTGAIDADATGTLSNTATITAPAGVTDADSANNSATDTDTLTPQADLSATKTDGKAVQVPGANDVYTLVFANSGPSGASGAILADAYPAIFTGVTWTCAASGGAACPSASGVGALPAAADLPAGGSVTFTVTGAVSSAATGTLDNTATIAAPGGVTDSNPGNNAATDSDALTPQADLSVTKTDGVASIVPGANDTYTLVFANAGPSDAPGAVLDDLYPAIFTGVTWTCSASGAASCPSASGAGSLPATVDLPAGGSLSFAVTGTVSPAAAGTLSNTAAITAPAGITDANPGNNSATDADTLTPQADLSVTKTDGSATAVPGVSNTYTILFANAGPSDAPGAVLDDFYPAVFTGVTWTCTASGGASCPSASGAGSLPATVYLPSGGSLSFAVTGTVSPAATGALSNTAAITAPAGVMDTDPANNASTDADILTPQADLYVTKTDGSATAVPGANTTYTILFGNNGPSDAPAAGLVDIFPIEIETVAWTCTASGGAACPSASGVGALPSAADLPVGGSLSFSAVSYISPDVTGTLDNTASVASPAGVTDPAPANNSATDSDTLTPQADLSVTKTDGVASIVPGTNDTYIIVFANLGPSDAPASFLADTYPAIFTGVTWTCTASGTFTCPAASGAGSLPSTADLHPGGALTFTVSGAVSPAAAGTLDNTAMVTAPAGVTDADLSNNSSTDSDGLTPQADLYVTKTDGKTNQVPGANDTYTIVFGNNGPSDAPGAVLDDLYPPIFTAVTWTCSASGGAACSAPSGAGSLPAAADLPAGGSLSFAVSGLVDAFATGALDNTASVTIFETVLDPNQSNNAASDSDTLTPVADLSVTKTDGLAAALPGQAITYTVGVQNGGPSNAPGVLLSDSFPAAFTGGTWTCAASGGAACPSASGSGSLSVTVDLPAGGSLTYVVGGLLDPAFTGALSNTASVLAPASVTDPDPANNTATDLTEVQPLADLALSKSAIPGPLLASNPLTYAITVTNQGPSPATGVIISDTLPLGASFTSASAACSLAGRLVTCQAGNLSAGSSSSFTLTVTPTDTYTGTLTNTAAASSDQSDPALANNRASASTYVVDHMDIYVNDFGGSVGQEWCSNITDITPMGARQFLGQFYLDPACLTLSGLPNHKSVVVSLDLFILRSWDGNQVNWVTNLLAPYGPSDPNSVIGPDTWQARLNQRLLLNTSFTNWDLHGFRQSYPGSFPGADYPARTGAVENNTLGYYFDVNPMDSVYHLTLTAYSPQQVLDLVMQAYGLSSGITDESWGLDNIKVTIYARNLMKYVYMPVITR